LEEENRITQKILLSILKGNSNVSEIRVETGLHRKTLTKYLPLLTKRKLIELKTKGWKKGKSKSFSITGNGISWLINNSLNETLKVLTEVVAQSRKPQFREAFNKARNEHNLRNTKLIQNYLVERSLKGDKTFEPPEFDQTDFDQQFRESLEKILGMHIYLTSCPSQTPEEIDNLLEKSFALFAPKMKYLFSWHQGAFPELEHQIYETDKIFREESEKLERSEGKKTSRVTHLLGLDFVDEKYFEQYVKATSDKSREKIMAKIENDAGWNVSQYLSRLFKGKQSEVDKYVYRAKRPYLREFIALFEN